MTEKLMLGNEAVARGAWEAGVNVVSSYPGTPSTEITECAAKYDEIYTEWAINEKVALEVCCGSSVGGARAMCCMKHVGVNVAADPLFTAAYTGVRGGLVVVCADDPGMHSSQNEQDSRFYARSAHLPMLEPSDSQECKDFTRLAFEMSEKFDTPVMLRTTTRIAHSRSMVELGERAEVAIKEYVKDAAKYVMMPAMARPRHLAVEKRMDECAEYVNDCPSNRIIMNDTKIGVICSGMSYQYVREALQNASILKLGIVYPLPRKLIADFAKKVDRLVVIEELEPFIEDQILAWGIKVEGVTLTGVQGELSVNKVKSAFGLPIPEIGVPDAIPGRPPVMCAGCPHRGPYSVLSRLGYHVTGDIGCYTLGALKPLCALDTTLCMGASIGMAQGLERARGSEFSKKTVAVIGDSTFLHSGVTSLINAVYNQSSTTIVILDNTITGMTGHQPNPNTGREIHGNPAPKIDLEALCRGCGVKRVRIVDSFDLKAFESAVVEETAVDEVSVIIAHRPCALLDKKKHGEPYKINASRCVGCGMCMRLGCPAIAKSGRKMNIDQNQCVSCGLCYSTCRFGAIERSGDDK